MSKVKRMLNNNLSKTSKVKSKNSIYFVKFFIIFLVITITLFLLYIFYKYATTSSKNVSSYETDFKSVSSKNLKSLKVVEGLEFINITKIDISTSENGASIIEIHFKNTTSQDIEETAAHFYALDSENNTIFGMPLKIPKLSANFEASYKVLCTSDLSNAKDYKISIE